MEFLAEINNTTVQGVIDWHTGREHWVSAVGFQPSTYQTIPLDVSEVISAPKYERPRKTTPGRIVCLAGQITSFYPFESPGGYQLLGRTLRIFDLERRNVGFGDSPFLLRPRDRISFFPVEEEELEDNWKQIEAGEYSNEIEESPFAAGAYLEWLPTVADEATERRQRAEAAWAATPVP